MGEQDHLDGTAVATAARPPRGGRRLERDLFVALDRGAALGLRAQLEQQLRDGVRSGRLHAETALPSSRALAAELGVSRGIVVDAYAQLVAEGYLVTKRGSATRVARIAPRAERAPAATPDPRPVQFDFRLESADVMAFPRQAWLAALRQALRDAPAGGLRYGDPAGVPALRAALAAYAGRSRGVVADADRVVVTSGILQAIGLLAASLLERGIDRVAVEDPGFPIHRVVLEKAGVQVVAVTVDDEGLRVQDIPSGVRAVLVTPAHQQPLGVVMAPARRAALVEWAAAVDGVVLEDDYDGEYRYDREPLGAVQGLDPSRVVYLGSASKTLAPALRLGWAVLPADLARAMRDGKGWADGGCPSLDQLALAAFVERGELDRHLRRMRAVYRRRRDRLVAALERRLPDVEVGGIAAGLHVTVRLPLGTPVLDVLGHAWDRGVGIYGFEHQGRAYISLGYGNAPEASIEPGVAELEQAIRSGSRRR